MSAEIAADVRPTVNTTVKSTDRLIADTTDKSTERLIADTIDKSTERLIADTTDKSTERLIADTIDKSTERLIADTIDKSTERLIADTIDKSTERLIADTTDKPTERLIADTTEKPGDKTTPHIETEPNILPNSRELKPLGQRKHLKTVKPLSVVTTAVVSVMSDTSTAAQTQSRGHDVATAISPRGKSCLCISQVMKLLRAFKVG
jgi:hypothetical protein